ncbi:hypothetical protein RM533_04370 [Croceicoccus sp. F390]|uniref:Integrase n=1 Tax=Croceicoccus esteveae TaxID=3075597 RepID=A0ABU2ZIL1_9SPHN|nr:hypothetical protein [Croceicoccus sp. F390]MDT0575414.1 hypothetical protein [Croceicoccus sp. F390]
MEFSTDPTLDQCNQVANYTDRNPAGRARTSKYRPLIRALRQMVALLNANEVRYVNAASIRTAFRQMAKTLGFPASGNGQSEEKPIRRSVASTLLPMLEKEKDWDPHGRLMLERIRPD